MGSILIKLALASSILSTGLPSSWWKNQESITVTIHGQAGYIFNRYTLYQLQSFTRGTPVQRRYSEFVFLWDCLVKRYPFRILVGLPPKRIGRTCYNKFFPLLFSDPVVQPTKALLNNEGSCLTSHRIIPTFILNVFQKRPPTFSQLCRQPSSNKRRWSACRLSLRTRLRLVEATQLDLARRRVDHKACRISSRNVHPLRPRSEARVDSPKNRGVNRTVDSVVLHCGTDAEATRGSGG